MRHFNEDLDIFSQKKHDPHNDSVSTTMKWDDEIEDNYEQLDEEEFYMSHKRSKIKSKHHSDAHFNGGSLLKSYKSEGKLPKPQKINTVIENY